MYRYKATLISISLAIFLLLVVLALSKTATAKLDADSLKFDQVGQVHQGEPSFLTGPNQGQPLDIALEYISTSKDQSDLNASDLSDILVTDQYTSKHTGVTHIYLRQRYEGIEIINANININIARDGSVINLGSSFVADLEIAVNDTVPKLYPTDAVASAADSVGLSLSSPLTLEESASNEDGSLLYSDGGVSQEPIPVKLIYESQEGGVYLAWNVEIYEKSGDHWWSTRVDAVDGSILSQYDRVVHDQWDSTQKGDFTEAELKNELDINPLEINSIDNLTGTYLVYALPDESPIHSNGRSLVVNPAEQTASPFGWHDDDGVEGPDYTLTRGNNVYAYTDRNDNDIPDSGSSPDGGSSLVFSYTLDLDDDPSTYRPAAVTNLFYWNNIMHDVSYLYGFDEEAGNFQENNYDRGGVGSDSVNAEAQDGASVGKANNANFATPSDGGNPRMQMFLWDDPNPDRDGDLDNGIISHEYGHGISIRLVGGPNNVNCLNNVEQMGEGWSDWQSMIMTMKPGDNSVDGRGVGTYALGESPNGPGIREITYSTDLDINNYTYGNLDNAEISIPHGVGFIWNSMLWEMLWALIDVHGFNPNIYDDWESGGNNLAHQLVIDGMKLTTCSPGFVDARNAVLQADQVLTGGVNKCTIWRSFARRGLGYSANQGFSFLRGDEIEAYDAPAECAPVIQVSPESIQSEVYTDPVKTEQLSIANNGIDNLVWELQETNEAAALGSGLTNPIFSEKPTNLDFILDDRSSEASVGGNNIGQFIWLNRFTPAAGDFPITLTEVWIQFSQSSVGNGDIEIFIHEDADEDGDPGTGSSLVAKYSGEVQNVNDRTWSKYNLNPAASLEGPGDILIGVVNRFASSGMTNFPANIDLTSSQQRSWAGTYQSGIAPDEPIYPTDGDWGLIDNLNADLAGNWMIKAFGYRSCANIADISWLSVSPTSGEIHPGNDQEVEITLDSTGLDLGDYNANLCIASNDISNPLETVPVTLTVISRPEPPLVTPDSYTMTEDTVLDVPTPGVLENDVSFFNELIASLDKQTISGTVELKSDGSFTYTPSANFDGIDWYTYLAFDGLSSSEPVTVTLRVEADNDTPQSLGDKYVLNGVSVYHEAAPGVLFNDFDIDGDDLTAQLERDPLKGTLNLNSNGSFTYTPTQMIDGHDSFSYFSHDGAASSNLVTVTLTLTNYNQAPLAENDTYSATMEIALSVNEPGVLNNDTDLDGDNLTALLKKEPDNGDLLLRPDGSFVYTPTTGFIGQDIFKYRASDGLATSEPASVYINVIEQRYFSFLPVFRTDSK